ncbi:MAG: hypothetical protein HKN27_17145 [Silicimonas sp.]|nr:hypothetical protein [Silicimonas sp.]
MPTDFWARTDSNSANNPALNLTGDDAILISFTPSGTNGDVVLDYNGGSIDPDTQVLIDGVAYNFTFESSSTLPTTVNQGAGQIPDQFEGSVNYLITVQDYPTAGESTRLAFLPEETATQEEMDAFGNGAIRLQNIDTTTPGGPVCFATGTLIATPKGEKPVETLIVGDLVVTADDGPLPIVWISSSSHCWPGSSKKSLPILISAGALGDGKPCRDLVVSPLHKVTVPIFKESGDVLVPAKGLTALRGVRVMRGKRSITYFHVMLSKHAVIQSERLPTESFYPGGTAMEMLRREQKDELLKAFPELSEGASAYGPIARPSLTASETTELVDALSADRALSA